MSQNNQVATLDSTFKELGELAKKGSIDAQYRLATLHIQRDEYKVAEELLLSAADSHHVGSQYLLGKIYLEEQIKDVQKSLKYLEQASQQDHPKAQYLLGKIYLEGIVVPKNLTKAEEYFDKASKNGNLDATHQKAIMLLEDLEPANNMVAIDMLEKLHQKNHAPSQRLLGEIYHYGQFGYAHNAGMALKYLSHSAENNDAQAQFLLGQIFLKEKNLALARKWLSKASISIVEALYLLSEVNLNDAMEDTEVNDAVKTLTSAADKNHPGAQYRLSNIYAHGEYNVPKDPNKARQWLEKAANNNFTPAKLKLATDYLYPTCLKAKTVNANLKWFEKVFSSEDTKDCIFLVEILDDLSKKNEPSAQYFLGKIYFEGKVVEQNTALAKELLDKAVSTHQGAQYLLGQIHLAENNVEEAIKYLSQASQAGHHEASYSLGQHFFAKKEFNNAKRYLIPAAAKKDVSSSCLLGKIFFQEGACKDALKHLHTAIEEDNMHAEATYLLGKIYYEGCDGQADPAKGEQYLNYAKDLGNLDAAYMLYGITHPSNEKDEL